MPLNPLTSSVFGPRYSKILRTALVCAVHICVNAVLICYVFIWPVLYQVVWLRS